MMNSVFNFLSFDYSQTIYFIVKMDNKCSGIHRASTSRDLNGDEIDSDINASVCSHSSLNIAENQTDFYDFYENDASNEDSELLTLNNDCLWEIFKYLSFDDILTLREICKRLKSVVDLYFGTYHPGKWKFKLSSESHFKMFCNMDADSIKLVKELEITLLHESISFDKIANVLNNVESIEIGEIYGKYDVHNYLLKYCGNVKTLCLTNQSLIGDKWSNQHYPKLENVCFSTSHLSSKLSSVYRLLKPSLIERFFHTNPQIHTLSIDYYRFLDLYGHELIKAGIKFDVLWLNFSDASMDKINYEKLYNLGLYKRLHLSFCAFKLHDRRTVDCLENVWNVVECIHYNVRNDFNLIAKFLRNFRKLKHIHISYDSKLERITRQPQSYLMFYRIKDRNRFAEIDNKLFVNDVINLPALNEERKTLDEACKTTIYVDDRYYSATKLAFRVLEFSMIQVKRTPDNDFDLMFSRNKLTYDDIKFVIPPLHHHRCEDHPEKFYGSNYDDFETEDNDAEEDDNDSEEDDYHFEGVDYDFEEEFRNHVNEYFEI